MDLRFSGHPLHTRFQSVVVRRLDDGAFAVEGEHLDLRKRGFVPVGSDLQASGIIHQMNLRAGLDPARRALTDVVSGVAVPAFEPSELSRGESCRDIAGPQADLRDLPLGATASRAISLAMSGVRGCSHVLALAQLVASATLHALGDSDGWQDRPPGRLFHRSLAIDGAQPDDRTVELAVQLSDLFFLPAVAAANPMDRFGHQNELRVLARIELEGVTVRDLEVSERIRGRDDLATAPWRRRDELVAELHSVPFLSGFAGRVFERFPQPGADRPLVDALLALAPTFIQVCATFSEDWPARCMAVDTQVGIGGIPDACYMWRRDGALHARKKSSDPIGEL